MRALGVLLGERGVIRLQGPDARQLLQGLVTNDVDRLSSDRALYAALLTPQGKFLFDFLLYELDGAILLDAEALRVPALVQRLTMYRLRAKATIEDVSDAFSVVAVPGAEAASLLVLPAEAGAARAVEGGLACVDPRLAELGLRAIVRPDRLPGFMAEHGLAHGSAEAYDLHRLRLGVPDGTRDLIPEKSILLENGFEELNGVSFTKGCFVGQELTARTKHRALIKKRLIPVRVEGPLPEPGTQARRGGRDAGEMRSGRDGHALALLRLDQLGLGSEPLEAGNATLTPMPPDWLRMP